MRRGFVLGWFLLKGEFLAYLTREIYQRSWKQAISWLRGISLSALFDVTNTPTLPGLGEASILERQKGYARSTSQEKRAFAQNWRGMPGSWQVCASGWISTSLILKESRGKRSQKLSGMFVPRYDGGTPRLRFSWTRRRKVTCQKHLFMHDWAGPRRRKESQGTDKCRSAHKAHSTDSLRHLAQSKLLQSSLAATFFTNKLGDWLAHCCFWCAQKLVKKHISLTIRGVLWPARQVSTYGSSRILSNRELPKLQILSSSFF